MTIELAISDIPYMSFTNTRTCWPLWQVIASMYAGDLRRHSAHFIVTVTYIHHYSRNTISDLKIGINVLITHIIYYVYHFYDRFFTGTVRFISWWGRFNFRQDVFSENLQRLETVRLIISTNQRIALKFIVNGNTKRPGKFRIDRTIVHLNLIETLPLFEM